MGPFILNLRKKKMATIPQFGSVGKNAEGVLDPKGKKFSYGKKKLNVKTKAANGVSFTTDVEQSNDGSTSKGSVEGVLKCSEHGMTFKEKWSTANQVDLSATFADQGVKGLEVSVKGTFKENKPLSGSVGVSFANDLFATDVKINAASNASYVAEDVEAQVTVGQSGFVGGAKGSCSVDGTVGPVDVKLGYVADDFQATFLMDDTFKEFGFNYHQSINKALAVAAEIKLAASSSVPTVQVGAVYNAANNVTYRVRVDSKELGLVYAQDLAFSAAVGIDITKPLSAGTGGKGGINFTFSA